MVLKVKESNMKGTETNKPPLEEIELADEESCSAMAMPSSKSTIESVSGTEADSTESMGVREETRKEGCLWGRIERIILSMSVLLGVAVLGAGVAWMLSTRNAPDRSLSDQPPTSFAHDSEPTTASLEAAAKATRLASDDCVTYEQPPPLSGKKGAAFALRPGEGPGSWEDNLPKMLALDPYWVYTWSPELIPEVQGEIPDEIEWMPMIWGKRAAWDMRSALQRSIDRGGVKRILGFNEPDLMTQSNMKVEMAVALWPVLEEFGLPLASPSYAHPERQWALDFQQWSQQECLRVDYAGVHWYGEAKASVFKQHMWQYFALHGRRLLITEFAPADWSAKTVSENVYSQEQVLEFMKEVVPWMEAPEQWWIAGYAWFPFTSAWPAGAPSALYNDDGSMTPLGEFYASVTNDNPYGDQSITASTES